MIASIGIQKIKVLFVLSLKQTVRNMKKLRLGVFYVPIGFYPVYNN